MLALDSAGQQTLNTISSIGKFPLSWKFKVDNSEGHAITYRNREIVKTSKMKVYLFSIQGSVFWRAKFKSYVYFCRGWPENLDNIEKPIFLDYREYRIWRQGFLEAGHPKPRFGPKKLINSNLFAAGYNNTLELISNWTAEFDFS